MISAKKAPAMIGWREWLELPELCATPIKAKIDTGARTSALHAFGLEVKEVDGVTVAMFDLHPSQRSSSNAVSVTCLVDRFRTVRSSNGQTEERPVIVTAARLGAVEWPIEISLTTRDEMGFRMLLGRTALRQFIVHPGRSFIASSHIQKRKGRRL